VTSVTTAPAGVAITPVNNVTQLTCNTNVVTLIGSSTTSGVSYSWSGPNGYTATSSAINVFAAGVYTLTVTNPTTGCTATASTTVTANMTPPAGVAINPSLATLTCSSPSALLMGSSTTTGATFSWTGPNSFTASGTTATAVSAGQYILTVTNPANGCTNTTTATISQNFAPPSAVTAINNGPLTCQKTSVTLTGNSNTSGVTFAWTGPNGFTASGATATASVAGIYTLTVTNPANGCTAVTTTVVAQDLTVPQSLLITSNTGAPVLTCSAPSITLTGSSSTPGTSYNWSGPSGQLSLTASAVVNSTGVYSLTATNPATGCASSLASTVTQNITPPQSVTTMATPTSAQVTCSSPNVVLTGGSSTTGVSYGWTGPSGFSASGSSATVTNAGAYTLTVTDPTNGCVTTATATVTKNVNAPIGLAASAKDIITCFTPVIDLQGTSTTPGATFSWTGPGGYTANTAIAETDLPGAYTLVVTNPANGCTASIGTTVLVDTATPAGVMASNNGPLNCVTTSVTLSSSSTTSGVDFTWVTPDNNFLDGATTVVTAPGTYTIVVTNNGNGCSSQATTTVIRNNTGCSGTNTVSTGAAVSKMAALPDAVVDSVTGFTYKAYPNPFRSTVFVEFVSPESTAVSVELYSLSGYKESVLYNGRVNANQDYKFTMGAGGLSSGTHFCVIRTAEKVYTIKLLLMK
jgi:hypothetical protein